MNPKYPTLSAYDFLGYLFPGFITLLLVDFSYCYHLEGFSVSYQSLVARYSGINTATLFTITIISYFIGHIVSFVSSVIIDKYSIWSYGHPKDYLTGASDCDYFGTSKSESPATSFLLRFVVLVFMHPILIFDYTFGQLLGLRKNYIKPLDPLIRTAAVRAIIKSIKKCGIDDPNTLGSPVDHEFDKLALHYVLEEAPVHAAALKNYVVLYGFLRSTCFISILCYWAIYIHLYMADLALVRKYVYLLVVALICLTCFLNFYKFFRRYFEETFLAIIIIAAKERDANEAR